MDPTGIIQIGWGCLTEENVWAHSSVEETAEKLRPSQTKQGKGILGSGSWGGAHKNTGTDLEMSRRSQQEPAMSEGPEGSLVWCIWGGSKVSPHFAVLCDPWRVLRGTPNKRLVTNKGGLLFKHYLKSKLKETFLSVFSGISPGKKNNLKVSIERKSSCWKWYGLLYW